MSRVAVSCALAIGLAACGDDGVDPARYHEVSRLEVPEIARAETMLVDGDVLYVGHRAGIVAVGLDSSPPRILGRNDFSQVTQQTQQLFRDGNHLYAGHGSHLTVLDISDPTMPAAVKTVMGNLQGTGDMGIIGNTLVLGGSSGLRFFDVTDRGNPVDTAVYEQSRGSMMTFVLDGSIAYIEVGGGATPVSLIAMDLTDPLLGNRELLSEVPGPAGPFVQVGDTVYSANHCIVDVSYPAAVTKRNEIIQPNRVPALAHHDGILVQPTLSNRADGFEAGVDFLDAGDLRLLGNVQVPLPFGNEFVGVASAGGRVIALYNNGLVVLGTD